MQWHDIKVHQLPVIFKLKAQECSELTDVYDRDVELLCVITGHKDDYFWSMSPKEFGEWRRKLYELLATEPAKEFNPVFKIGGRKFSTAVSVNNVTVDQLADIHLLNIDGNNYYSNLHNILAVFAKEKRGWKFWQKPLSITAKAELFKQLPADTANSISLFFCKVSPVLESVIASSLEKQITTKMKQVTKNLQQYSTDTAGSPQSTSSPTGTLRKRKPTSN
jgi:hypothetical protein